MKYHQVVLKQRCERFGDKSGKVTLACSERVLNRVPHFFLNAESGRKHNRRHVRPRTSLLTIFRKYYSYSYTPPVFFSLFFCILWRKVFIFRFIVFRFFCVFVFRSSFFFKLDFVFLVLPPLPLPPPRPCFHNFKDRSENNRSSPCEAF